MNLYDPLNWYWIVGGDETQVFSSKTNAFVPVDDASYIAWDNTPTSIDTLANLKQVLTDAGASPYLIVTPARARIVLSQAGKLAAVEAVVAQAPEAVQIYWNYATEIHRIHPYVAMLGAAVGMSEVEIDALFVLAAQP